MKNSNSSMSDCNNYLQKIQIEIDALFINKQGDDYFAEGQYEKAK